MPGTRVFVVQHVACEDLGTFATVLAERGSEITYVRPFAGDAVPDAADARALIILGGPMSANDTAALPYLAAERELLAAALLRDLPVLGVCLGSQLLAAAAGAAVFRAARAEIGWAPLGLTPEGRQDPLLAGAGALAAVFHWHGETFDLPPGATRLAFSASTLNQAFRLGRAAYGLQFHLEVDAAAIEAWMKAYPDDLEPEGRAAVQRIGADTRLYAPALRAAAGETMHRFLDLVAAG